MSKNMNERKLPRSKKTFGMEEDTHNRMGS